MIVEDKTKAYLLMVSKKSIVILNEEVKIRLIEECDPMWHMTSKQQWVNAQLPIELEAVVQNLAW